MATSGATQLSAASSIMSSLSAIPGPSSSGLTLTPSTPLSSLLPPPANPLSSGAASVGAHSPPIPEKLAKKIWKGEFIELHELLPSRLGAPEVTLLDLMSGKDKLKDQKKITTIQQWEVCFSSFMSVTEIRHPERVRELIAYLAMITKASQDYEGLPWLAYDSHFRRVAAASGSWEWSQVNPSLWTLYFSIARLATEAAGGLAIIPVQPDVPKATTPLAEKSEKQSQHGAGRLRPYPRRDPICIRWNKWGCRESACNYRHICLECHSPNHRSRECSMSMQPAGSKPPTSGANYPFRQEGPRKGPP